MRVELAGASWNATVRGPLVVLAVTLKAPPVESGAVEINDMLDLIGLYIRQLVSDKWEVGVGLEAYPLSVWRLMRVGCAPKWSFTRWAVSAIGPFFVLAVMLSVTKRVPCIPPFTVIKDTLSPAKDFEMDIC